MSAAVWDKLCNRIRVATQAEKAQMIKFKYKNIKLKNAYEEEHASIASYLTIR
jgi:hypothetical protein